MALRARNNIELVIDSSVEGLTEINRLVNQLDQLGNEGKDAAADLSRLTEELRQISTQQRLVTSFREQKRATQELAEAYRQARQRSTELGQALSKVASPTKTQTAEFEKARKTTRDLARAYGESQQAIEKLRRELRAAGLGADRLAQSQAQLASRAKIASQSIGELNTHVQRLAIAKPAPDVTKKMREGAERTSSVISGIPRLLGLIGVTAGLAQVVSAFVEAAKSGETFARSLDIITGSASEAAAQQQRLLEISEKYGIEVTGLEKAFINFNAAVAGTNFEGERGNEIFEAFAGSMGLLGKSSADIEGALLAVNQIISKNTVSSEELRLQLAERLPGAMRLSAEALGITNKQLSEQLRLGKVTADDLLPKLAARLRDTYGLDNIERVETLAASIGRLATATTNAFRALSESGVGNFLSSLLDGAAGLINFFSGASDEASEFALTADSVAQVTQKLSPELQALAKDMQQLGLDTDLSVAKMNELRIAQERLQGLRNLDALREQQAALTESIANTKAQLEQLYQALGNPEAFGVRPEGIEGISRSVVLLEASLNLAEIKLKQVGESIDKILNPALETQEENSRKAAESANNLAIAYQALVDAQQELLSEAERELVVADAQSKAKLEQARAVLKIAEARGKEKEALKAAVDLAKIEADIAVESAKKKRLVAQAAADVALALQKQANADKQVTDAEQAGIDKATEYAAVKRAEAEASLSVAEALQAEAKAQENLSNKIGNIKAAFDASLESVNAVLQQLKTTRQAADETAGSIGKIAEAQDKIVRVTNSVTAALAAQINGTRAQLRELSVSAEAAFNRIIESGRLLPTVLSDINIDQVTGGFREATGEAALFKQQIADLAADIRSERSFTQFGDQITRLFSNIQLAGAQVKKAFLEQRLALQQLLDQFKTLGTEGGTRMEQLVFQAQRAVKGFDLLSDTDLSPLYSEIDGAKRRMDELAQKTEDVRRRLAELNAEIAEAQGNKDRAEELRLELEFQERLAQVEAELAEARALAQLERVKLLEQEKRRLLELLRLRRQQIEEEERNRRERDRDRDRDRDRGSSGSGASSSGVGTQPQQPATVTPIRPQQPVTFNFNAINGDQNAFRRFVEEIGKELKRQNRLAS